MAFDALVSKLYVQSITIPDLAFEYESNGSATKTVTKVIYPDTITITFLENEKGLVQQYISEWRDRIAAAPSILQKLLKQVGFELEAVTSGFLGADYSHFPDDVKFGSNQDVTKRLGILMLTPVDRSTPLSPRIEIRGLKYKSRAPYTVSQAGTANLLYSVEFSVDSIKIPTLI